MQRDDACEPVRYTGKLQPDPAYYDGRLPHAAGVHHVQVFRGTRSRDGGGIGFTYNHQPYLVWWQARFYLHYLGAPRHEHEMPTVTFLCSSPDGYQWSEPAILFPEYPLAGGGTAVMHQRMGFFVAPGGRLLALGFYGICPDSMHSPNAGNGIGRVVREIRGDGSWGEVHFIRYNRHCGFSEENTAYPFYSSCTDAGFRAACEALLTDKLATLQWWEEDRSRDGFFSVDPGVVPSAAPFTADMVTSEGAGKAFAWYTRPDGLVVGLWKNQYSALSDDHGETWTPIVRNRTLRTTGAKTWGQRTSDGRYAIVYNHSATRVNRFPVAALVGDDGRDFPTLLCLGGEVPPRRFVGLHKGAGKHYFRGISEGSAQPPDGCLWVAYSMNKEDIWVLRAQVPLTAHAPAPASDEVARAASLADLVQWNFHLPRWTAARLAVEEASGRRVLELSDENPYDYVAAERIFPALTRARLQFRIQTRAMPVGRAFEVEVQSQRHDRPIRLQFTHEGLFVVSSQDNPQPPMPLAFDRWYSVELRCDCVAGTVTVRVDQAEVGGSTAFAEPAATLERVVFRTGPWRGRVPDQLIDGSLAASGRLWGEDLPGADRRTDPLSIRVDAFTAEAV